MFSAFNLSEDELSVGANVVAPCVPVTGVGGEEIVCYFAYDETGSPIKNNATAVHVIRNIDANIQNDPLQLDGGSSTIVESQLISKNEDNSRFLDKEQTIPKIVVTHITHPQISSGKIDDNESSFQRALDSATIEEISPQNEDGNGGEITIDCDDCEEFEEISSAKAVVEASFIQAKGRWSNKKRIGKKASTLLNIDEGRTAGSVKHELLIEPCSSNEMIYYEAIPSTSFDEQSAAQNGGLKRKLESSEVVSEIYIERSHLSMGIGSGKGASFKQMMSGTKKRQKDRGLKKRKLSSNSLIMDSEMQEEEDNEDIENQIYIPTPKWRVVPMSPFKRLNDDGSEELVNATFDPNEVYENEQDSALNDNEAAEVLIQIGQVAVCTGNNALACMDCGQQCKTKRDLKRHMLLHTGDRVLECSQCNYKTNRTNRMKAHIKTHTGEKNYFCSKCDFGSIQKSNFNKHMYVFHNQKVSCHECDFTCMGRFSLNEHKKVHYADKKYACGECDYRTNCSSALKCHLTTHTKVKPAKCPECDQCFRDSYGMKLHLLIHTGEKPFTCFKCNYTTISQEYLDKHLNDNHTAPTKKISNYRIDRICKDCGYTCKTEKTFAVHLQYHEKYGPMMKCDKCDYVCKKYSTMREHLLRHKGKILRCELCNFRFLNPKMYDAHMIAHAQNEFMSLKPNFNKKANKPGRKDVNWIQKEEKVKAKKEGEGGGRRRKGEKLSKRKIKEEKMRADKAKGSVMKRKRSVLKDVNKGTSDKELNDINGVNGTLSKTKIDEDGSVSNENVNVYFCGSCNFSSNTKKELNAHIPSHTFNCGSCNFTSHTKKELNIHIPIHSFNKQFTCLECGFCCDQHLELVTHIQTHKFSKKQIKRIEYECRTCKINFSSKLSLENHKKEYHSNKNNNTDGEDSLTDENSYCQNIEYECPKCDYKHELQSKIKEHIIEYHNVQLGHPNNTSESSKEEMISKKDAICTTEDDIQTNNDLNKNIENCESESVDQANNADYNDIDDQHDELIMSDADENDVSQSSTFDDSPIDDNHDDDTSSIEDTYEYECPMCDFKGSTKEDMKEHIIIVHKYVTPNDDDDNEQVPNDDNNTEELPIEDDNFGELPNDDEAASSSKSSPKLRPRSRSRSRSETDGYMSEPDDSFTLVLDDSEESDDECNDAYDTSNYIKSEAPESDKNYIQDTIDNDDSDIEFLEEVNNKSTNKIVDDISLNEEDSSPIENDTPQVSVSDIDISNAIEQPNDMLQMGELKKSEDKSLSNKKLRSNKKGKKNSTNYIGVKTKDGAWKCISCDMIFEKYNLLRIHKKNNCDSPEKNKKELEKNQELNTPKKISMPDENDESIQNNEESILNNEESIQNNEESFQNDDESFQNDDESFQNDDETIQNDDESIQNDTESFQNDTESFQNDEESFQNDTESFQNDEESLQIDKKLFQNNDILDEDLSYIENEEGKYICLECNKEYSNHRLLVYHMRKCQNMNKSSNLQMINIKFSYTKDGRWKCSNCQCIILKRRGFTIHKLNCMRSCRCAPEPTISRKGIRPPETKDGKWKCSNCNCLFLNCRSITVHKKTCMISCKCTWSKDRPKYDCPYCNCSFLRESTLLYKHIKQKRCMKSCQCTKFTKDKHVLKFLGNKNKDADDVENLNSKEMNEGRLTNDIKKVIRKKTKWEKQNKSSKSSCRDPKLYPFECKVCGDRFIQQNRLTVHTKKKVCTRFMITTDIENAISQKAELTKENTSNNSSKDPDIYPFECKFCKDRFQRKSSLTVHIKKKICKNNKFECQICKKSLKSRKSLLSHVNRCSENKYKCEKCPFRCKDEETLANHSCQQEMDHSCPECDKSFKRAKSLEFHMDLHNPEKKFSCSMCNYKCRRPEYLKNHVSSKHTTEKKFACDQCEYTCHYAGNLKKHSQTHDPSQQVEYECPRCDYKNKLKNRIKEHIMKVHEGIQIEKRHQCPLCPFKGRDPYVLRNHILVHTGEKPYECGECDFKCSNKNQLRRHIRIHTGETFNCTLCDFQTVDKNSLQTHYITHTGVKRYVCDEDKCDYKCNTIHRLKTHKQSHSKEKLFQCGECFKRLKDRISLMRHLTSQHIE